jgi:hypothetical protein
VNLTLEVGLISASAGLLGGIIGTSGTLVAGSLQHRRQVKAELDRERREHTQQAARNCDRLFRRLAEEIPENRHAITTGNSSSEETHERHRRILSALVELQTTAIDLPSPWREHIDDRIAWLWTAGELGSDTDASDGGFYYESADAITFLVSKNAHEVLAAFLRNEPLPEPSDRILEISVAYTEMVAEHNARFTRGIHQLGQSRTEWLDRHPDVKRELVDWAQRRRRG